jgi:transcriptional regulator with XRE-family HTH domain
MSQREAAKAIGVSLRQYCAWERKEQSASLDNLEKVATYYKVHEGELLK